jgi:hypothetical protein
MSGAFFYPPYLGGFRRFTLDFPGLQGVYPDPRIDAG